MKQMEPFELAKTVARLLDEKKAENINVIKIDDISSIADYFVIANGRGSTHVRSLADELEEKLKQQGIAPARIEGYRSDNWVLMDYESVVVHVFTGEGRDFYDLDRLWADGIKIDWEGSKDEV